MTRGKASRVPRNNSIVPVRNRPDPGAAARLDPLCAKWRAHELAQYQRSSITIEGSRWQPDPTDNWPAICIVDMPRHGRSRPLEGRPHRRDCCKTGLAGQGLTNQKCVGDSVHSGSSSRLSLGRCDGAVFRPAGLPSRLLRNAKEVRFYTYGVTSPAGWPRGVGRLPTPSQDYVRAHPNC